MMIKQEPEDISEEGINSISLVVPHKTTLDLTSTQNHIYDISMVKTEHEPYDQNVALILTECEEANTNSLEQRSFKGVPDSSRSEEVQMLLTKKLPKNEEQIYDIAVVKIEYDPNVGSVHPDYDIPDTSSVQESVKTELRCKKSGKRLKRISASCDNTDTKAIITEAKKLTCKICKKKFRHSSELKRHKVIHFNKKPFNCASCDAGFKRLDHLRRHALVHTGEKPFICEICNAGFTQSGNLVSHKMKHTGEAPYSCDICLKTFIISSHLTSHKLTHSDEKTFNCEICNTRFKRSNHLKTHRLIHTGEKPFACEMCHARFRRSCDLTRHILIHGRGKVS